MILVLPANAKRISNTEYGNNVPKGQKVFDVVVGDILNDYQNNMIVIMNRELKEKLMLLCQLDKGEKTQNLKI